MNSIELFGGAGGMAYGASRAEFDHLAFVELDRDACSTIRANQRRGNQIVQAWNLIEGDVHDVDFTRWNGEVDLITGGPPCQPFSICGKHRGHADDRNLWPQAVRAVRETHPRAFVFENVKGLTRESFARFFTYVQLQLTYPTLVPRQNEEWTAHLARLERLHTRGQMPDLHYRVLARVLDAADYGVPQRRHRVFIVGFRDDIQEPWNFPAPTHSQDALLWSQWGTGEYWDRHQVPRLHRPEPVQVLMPGHLQPWRTIRDAINGLGEPAPSRDRSRTPNHVIQPGARIYAGHTGSHIDCPAKTLKAGDHGVPGGENMMRFHNGEVRYFTVRESCRLQTFPDDYVFETSWTESMRQLGNAVPVDLGEAVINGVAETLEQHDLHQ